MILRINSANEKPIYEQIKEEVIKGILKKEITQGETLPSSRSLASSLDVNMHTVSKAYSALKNQGFVTVLRNKGVVVNSKEFFLADDSYSEKLGNNLESIVLEAKCVGIKEEEINKIVNSIYNRY